MSKTRNGNGGHNSAIGALSLTLPQVEAVKVVQVELKTHRESQQTTEASKSVNRLLFHPAHLLHWKSAVSMRTQRLLKLAIDTSRG